MDTTDTDTEIENQITAEDLLRQARAEIKCLTQARAAADELLQRAAEEIKSLRRSNELQGAVLHGVEMMAMAVSARPATPSIQMTAGECVVNLIERHLRPEIQKV